MKKLKIIITFLFLSMLIVSMTSCAVRHHEDHGRHRGWYKNNDHRDHNVYIIEQDNHRHQQSTHYKKVKGKSSDKNRWDAKSKSNNFKN